MTITEHDIRQALGAQLAERVKSLKVEGRKVRLTLLLRAGERSGRELKHEALRMIGARFPQADTTVLLEEPAPASAATPRTQPQPTAIPGVERVIAISSAKGGVGKSTLAAHLAIALAAAGKRVGLLDADIYGPSQPLIFDVEDYRPVMAERSDQMMLPARVKGISLMSIGFFIDPDDALIWRGPMAVSALRQLIRQTQWPPLDYLLVDLPPGTGDIHLSLLQELPIDAALIVTTPQSLALADVHRGISLFRSPTFRIPILGIVENMAWFSPPDAPAKRYFPFGENGGRDLALALDIPLLTQLPIAPTADDYASLARIVLESPI